MAKTSEELLELARKLHKKEGFIAMYFELLPVYGSPKETFEAVDDLHNEVFGEFRYACYEYFYKGLSKHLNKKKNEKALK